MILHAVMVLAGLALLLKGSDITIDAAKALARKYRLSHTVLGLTLVSVGTSLPEITTNLYVGARNSGGAEVSGIAVGLIIGSQITQITLILGAAALIGTMYVRKHTLRRELPMLFVALFGFWIVALDGFVSRTEGVILVGVYIAYLLMLNRHHGMARSIRSEMRNNRQKHISARREFGVAIVGLLVLIVGGKLVVDGAEYLALDFGISQSLIGILVIGPGAALPELSVAVSGMRKKASGISLGALLGSNITDPLFSFGLGATVAGYTFDSALLAFDLPYWLAATAVASLFIRLDRRIGRGNRWEGAVLLLIFAVYVALKLTMFN